MIEYAYDRDDLIPWAEERCPDRPRFRSDAHAIAIERDEEIAAVCVFDTFSENDCLVALASDGSRRWMTREFAVRCMAYPFIQLGLARISCLVSASNYASLRYTQHFGWKREGIMREAGLHGEDLILFGMLSRECRWLQGVATVPFVLFPRRGVGQLG